MSHGFTRRGFASTTAPSGPWPRPADWLPLPTVVSGDQKVVMLVAVFNTVGNYLAFSFTGPYTVDWGDGTAPVDYASGVTAQRSFAWGDYSASTVTSEGFRQAIVTITPQAGQNLNTVNLNLRHSTPTVAHSTGVLDVRVGAPYISGFSFNTSNVGFRMLRQFEWVGACSISDFTNMFGNCYSLTSIPALNTAAGTSFASMFNGCTSLTSVELTGCKYSVSVASCLLSGTALDTLYTSLGTAAASQSITVTGNYGTPTDTPSIATAKGWTVVGS